MLSSFVHHGEFMLVVDDVWMLAVAELHGLGRVHAFAMKLQARVDKACVDGLSRAAPDEFWQFDGLLTWMQSGVVSAAPMQHTQPVARNTRAKAYATRDARWLKRWVMADLNDDRRGPLRLKSVCQRTTRGRKQSTPAPLIASLANASAAPSAKCMPVNDQTPLVSPNASCDKRFTRHVLRKRRLNFQLGRGAHMAKADEH